MAAEESPEQIRERVHAEELAKGSDPRVAEGRAKAAELRAKAGLPIEPDKAWRAKLEQEGGEPSAAPAAAAEPGEAEEPAGEAEPAQPEPAAEAQPAAEAETQPAAAAPAEPARAEADERPALRVVEPAPATVAPTEPDREPEVGEAIEVETEGLEVVAGVAMRDAKLPMWLVGALLAIVLWALAYALFLRGPDVIERTTRCQVTAENRLVCSGVTTEPATP